MTAEILRPAPVLGARRAPQLDSNKHDQLDKSLRKRASDAAGKDSEQQEHRQQEADTRAADCMTEHSPYVWNPQSQRYERRRPSLAEAHQRSNDLQAQHYSPAAPASAAYQPHPQQPLDWNPWAYLDNSQQRPYTPSQPAVQPGTDLSEPYTHHNFQGRPVRPSQTLVNVYDSHESPRPGLGASSSVATPARGEPSHQYQPHYQATYAYSGWQADRSTFAPQDVSISLPPLNIPSRYSTADLPVTYKSSYTATSHTAASATAGYSTRYSPPVPPATTSYQGYDPLQPSRLSGDEAYHSIVPVDTANTAAAASIRTTRRSSTDWKDFLDFWKSYIEDGERVFVAQAAEGLIENYTPRVMAAQRPTFADCDALISGFDSSYRITVERLKQIIRGINSLGSRDIGHVKIAGNKGELIDRIIDLLQHLQRNQSEAYYPVARLVGEAQGYTYPSPGTESSTSAAPPAPPAGSSSATAAYPPRQYPSSSYLDILPAASASTSAPGHPYPSDYAVRPSQFGLTRSPGRPAGASNASYNTAFSSTSAYGQAGRPYSNSPNPQSQYRTAGASTGTYGSSSNAHAQQSGRSQYGTALSNTIPTSLPVPLPPRSAIAGQPAIPMNFKPSPFFKIISAVSTVTTMPRPAHHNERATGVAYVQLTDDQRQKLLQARDDPKAPQYQLRLYCTSGDFYYPHQSQYGTAARQALPIEFPLSSEAKMNDTAVVANLRGIKKKPGTAPPAHVSSAKVGTPSRTSSSSSNKPIGSWALNLENARDQNKVELVYMNTEKVYYMIVYFVEALTVSQVVEKIQKDKFRQKDDVLKSIHRAAEDPDIQATSSTLTMKDPLTYTALNIPIRSINCVHLQCFDAFCFLSMMEQTPDWKCPVCNRAITSDELVHDGFFQDIKDQLPSDGSIDTVIVEVDGTWRTEDNKYGNAKKAVEHREKIKNGLTADNLAQLDTSSSRGSSRALAKDGTPLDVKPDLASSAGLASGGLTIPNGASRGHSKSKTPAAVIELDDDDDEPYDNDETPPPPPRLSGLSNHTRLTSTSTGGGGANGRSSGGGGVIDLTLSDSEDEASSSVVGPGSRAPSIRTPGKSNGVAGARSGLSNSVFPRSASQTTTTSATVPPSSSTVNGDASGGGGNVVAGVKRRQDSEAAYEELWGMEPGLERDRGDSARDVRGSGERPSQIPRYS